jgi:hypothetical protein
MGRPEINGTVIDKSPAEAGAEGNHELETEAGEETNDALSEPGADAASDGGAEDQEVGGDVDQEEGAAGGEEEGAGADVEASSLHDIEKLKEQLRSELRAELSAEMRENQPEPQPKEISDEEWAKHEDNWGIPRKAITATVSRMERLAKHFEARLDERLAKFEKNDALRTLASDKGFTDAMRYQKDVDEFLSHYPAKHHSNPDLLKRAVMYSRGKNMKNNVNRARTESERNRRISGAGRPAPGGAPVKKGLTSRPLTQIERSAARAAGMSDGEYLKLKGSNKVLS